MLQKKWAEVEYFFNNPAVMTTHLVVPSQYPVGWFLSSFVVGASWFMSVKMGVGVLALGG